MEASVITAIVGFPPHAEPFPATTMDIRGLPCAGVDGQTLKHTTTPHD
jgi:hypothetical protein